MRKVLLLCLSVLYGTIGHSQIASCQIEGGLLRIDTSYFDFSGAPTSETDPFFQKVFTLNGQDNALDIKQHPQDSFALAFWVRFDALDQRAPLFSHAAEAAQFALYLEDGRLILRHFRSGEAGTYQASRSEHRILPGHWYYFNYVQEGGNGFLRMLSTNFKFEAAFPFAIEQESKMLLGKDSLDQHFKAALHQVQLYRYGRNTFAQLLQPYDQLELDLYTFHNLRKRNFRTSRDLINLSTIAINKKSFFIDIWDYDEVDNDSLRIIPGKNLQLFDKQKPVTETQIQLRAKNQRQTFQVRISDQEENLLLFSASSMGFMEKFNTATVRIHTDEEELWDTIHIKPNFDSDIQLRFQYDPNATAPVQEIESTSTQSETIAYPSLGSKSQKVLLSFSDFSLPDKDLIKIELNDQAPIIRQLQKKEQQILLALDRKDNFLSVSAESTSLFYCSAKVELFEVLENGGSRKIFSENLKIKKKERHRIPLQFSPKPLKEHTLLVRDSLVQISISDHQKVDGDSIRVHLDDILLLDNFGLSNAAESFYVPLDKPERVLYLAPTAKGTNERAANLCRVTVHDSQGTLLAEYVLQMLDLEDPGLLRLTRIE